MTKPVELANAQVIDSLTERYGSLPWPGALLEQPAIAFLRMQGLLALGGTLADERSRDSGGGESQVFDPLAALPMEAL